VFTTSLALVISSHYGGSLTHGSDYLVHYAPAPLRALLLGTAPQKPSAQPKVASLTDKSAFAALVQPVLQQNCVSCHGPEKSKGGLRVDSFELLAKGGKDGPAIVPGKSANSDLLRRVRLPATDEDHMPPEGKPQPSLDDIALLQWWVDAGASPDKKVAELKPPANIERILAARSGAAPAAVVKTAPPKPLEEVMPIASQLSENLGIALTPLSPKEPWLQCNASVAGTNFANAQLTQLKPIAANLRWLDLAGTGLTDAGLPQIAAMPNLTKLHLERTGVTDAGLACLAGNLPNLEYLNLYSTAVTDAGFDSLQKLPRLKRVYLWQSKVTPAKAKEFAESRLDQMQLQRWQEEIDQLKAKIQDAHIVVDTGMTLPAPPAATTNTVAINTMCPVSGKPVDAQKTVLYEGKLVAFCCDDCKAKFQQDPKPFLAKLDLGQTKQAKADAGK
jgi:YHS domain-containing protein